MTGSASNVRVACELVAQRLRQVGHLGEVAGAPLVDPAEQLRGAEALFAQRVAERGQTLQIEIEQVGRHRMVRPASAGVDVDAGEEEGDFDLRGFGGVGAVHGVGVDAVGEVGADGAGAAFLGSVAPIRSRFLSDRRPRLPAPGSITGPEIMNSTRSLKKGRSLCTA